MRRALSHACAGRRYGAGGGTGTSATVVLLALLLLPPGTAAHEDAEPEAILAPGYNELEFQAPQPGSYALPPLGSAGGAELLDTAGKRIELDSLFGDKLVVLSFIYSSCDDVNGCPLATFVLRKLQKKLDGHPDLNDAVRLISISFDPVKDTPRVMAGYRKNFSGAGPAWHFLTAPDEPSLQPLLEHYGQFIQREIDADGATTGAFAH
ncbi:MAG: SCO family protein, partial [Gammaproteobacteria bacterium]|nr:SCO family protein [Gammaproteobacteria bacterium]